MSWGQFQTDIWQVGIVHAPIAQFLEPSPRPVTWLPTQRDFCFLADPFGVWRDDHLHVFAEFYDYRDKHGVIRHYTYDRNFTLRAEGLALSAPHHLSYPYLIEDGGEVFMLPEAFRSGKLTLYRARDFPRGWEKVCDLLDVPAIDASVVKSGDNWWMFYALPGPDQRDCRQLHAAWAPKLTGPWTPHPMNPLRELRESSRPGGTPFAVGQHLYLPAQDCSHTYGGAVRMLRVDALTPTTWACTPQNLIEAKSFSETHMDGLHTVAACGNVTLIDVKRFDRSSQRRLIDWQRRWRRMTGQARAPR